MGKFYNSKTAFWYWDGVRSGCPPVDKVVCTKEALHIEVMTWKPLLHGPLARYENLRVAHAPGIPETFSLPPRLSDPHMHHGTCVTHVRWFMSGSLTSGFLWSQWRSFEVPASPVHAQPAILHSWQEAHYWPFVKGIPGGRIYGS